MGSPLRSLAGTAILTLPLAATAAVIPAATAQAGTLCGPDQATVHFATAPPRASWQASRNTAVSRSTAVCTGPSALAFVTSRDDTAAVPPKSCADYYPPG